MAHQVVLAHLEKAIMGALGEVTLKSGILEVAVEAKVVMVQ
jgi:hypothetical protein